MKQEAITGVFKVIIAIFVLYNGIDLLKTAADQSQSGPVINVIMGIVFVLIGAGFLIVSVKKKLLEHREQ